MILRRLYDDDLAQAAYLVGCAATGEALVVDPNRDVDAVIEAAVHEGVRITHVAETHIHADFVSGARQLAARTGARLHLSAEGGPDWSYAFAETDGALLLRDGDRISVGNIRVEALHTPGHTPEHLCFVITDTAGADRPMGVLTGDFLFAGDVGRPDLLERAANVEGSMQDSARELFRSLRRFRTIFPDYVQIWPGHGAGSACGKSLGAVPQTTLGYEKLFNWAFQHGSEDDFVAAALAGQTEPPLYFAEMKRINREGPSLDVPPPVPRLPDGRLDELVRAGAAVVDTRARGLYEASALPGSFHVPFGDRSFLTWAGSVLPFDRDLYVVAEERNVGEVVRALRLIGIDRVAGAFSPAAVEAWLEAHPDHQPGVPRRDPSDLERRIADGSETAVLDVRSGAEWEAGHVPGSVNLPINRIAERLAEIPKDRPVIVHCQTGARAMVGVGLLRAHGFEGVEHLAGDFAEWTRSGRPIESD